jgi:hypothetical protein|tara:strand:- start:2985 stop:3224 length:240 start_codon:yes stop_codon:yes gene_type:complete
MGDGNIATVVSAQDLLELAGSGNIVLHAYGGVVDELAFFKSEERLPGKNPKDPDRVFPADSLYIKADSMYYLNEPHLHI